MHNPESIQENETHKIPRDFKFSNRSSNLGQTTRPSDSQITKNKKRTYQIEDFAVPAKIIRN